MFWVVWIIFSIGLAGRGLYAQDLTADLLRAAEKGQTSEVDALLQRGANVDAHGKNGRTPLMLAARRGRVDTVRLLLAKGAKPEARDADGWTAYGLAFLDPAGRGDHEAVLKLLPPPPHLKVAVSASWSPAKLTSSCFSTREDLLKEVDALQLDEQALAEFSGYASTVRKRLAEIVSSDRRGMSAEPLKEAPAGADAVLEIEVQPSSACVAQNGDSLSLTIEARVVRVRDHEKLFEKTFGGGLKGLHAQTVNNASQYAPFYQKWIKPQAGPIYSALESALLRSAF